MKRKREDIAKVNDATDTCRKVLEAVLQKPSIFCKPKFAFLREFVFETSSHPLHRGRAVLLLPLSPHAGVVSDMFGIQIMYILGI